MLQVEHLGSVGLRNLGYIEGQNIPRSVQRPSQGSVVEVPREGGPERVWRAIRSTRA